MQIVILPEGLRLCRKMILEEYLEHPNEFLKVIETLEKELDINSEKLIKILIQAAAEGSDEFRARILKRLTR